MWREATCLPVGRTVGEALTRLRSEPLGQRIVYFYVVDEEGRMVGVVPTRRLLTADPQTAIASLMVRDVVTLPESASVDDAAAMFLRHRLLALPVVDGSGRVLGVADVSMVTGEVADMAARQSAEDMFQLVGAHATQSAGPWRSFRDRFPWLLCNVGGGLVAALIAGHYEGLLNAVISLALFIPVVLAVSESVGMQSVTLTLQSFHGSRVGWGFLASALRRELATAAMLGAGCGCCIGSVVWLWKGAPVMAAAVAVAVAMAMVTAALLGVALPGALRALRHDPRIAAGPIVLALTDFAALMFYFSIASWLLERVS